jgi:HSP20 family protein
MTALIPILRRHRLLGRPNRDFGRFFEDFDLSTLFSEGREFLPAFDVSETEKQLIVKAEVPGMDKEDIDISLSDGVLTIKGEKRQEREDKNEHYHTAERRYGAFSRTMPLPVEVDTNKVDATYKEGVLKIILPKSETAKAKKIEVKS